MYAFLSVLNINSIINPDVVAKMEVGGGQETRD